MSSQVFLDCTLRDGGYYNSWDFDHALIQDYLVAMKAVGVDVVELGFRTADQKGFKGACAYTTDSFIKTLEIPEGITFCVMINASEILVNSKYSEKILGTLFPETAEISRVSLVRIACHTSEFMEALHAFEFLNSKGYRVAFNLMQVSECDSKELILLAKEAQKYPFDVLYFADSLGNMNSEKVQNVIELLRTHWKGVLGIHAHDNIGLGLSNTLYAINEGVTWVDSTVSGMGRGAGNVKTELLAIEISQLRDSNCNMKPIMVLIANSFKPMKEKYGWGTNPFYYLSGINSVHPTYVQEMMADSRYNEEDIIAVIEHLGKKGGKKYSKNILGEARNYYPEKPQGNWSPVKLFEGKEVILIGSGPGVLAHKKAIETYIINSKPLVMALNAQTVIENDLIDLRIACHPLRLITDCERLTQLSQPLITPASIIPENVLDSFSSIKLLDYGMGIKDTEHVYGDTNCILSNPLVISYALAVVSSGKASRILLAGFDGYSADDPRRLENDVIFEKHQCVTSAVPLVAVTPTLYHIDSTSIYAI
jgi:4-hydroxy 2-oxovalerate aldolase